MQFVYGGYIHADNSVAFTNVQKTLIVAQNGRPHILKIDWGIEGKLISQNSFDPRTDIMNQLAILIAAYSINGQNAGFPGTPFYLNSSDAIGGVLVTRQPSHGEIRGAQGTTYLKYQIGLEAQLPYTTSGQVLDFQETISYSDNDGLPMTVERIPQNGPPIIQEVSQGSWYYATQSGSITHAFSQGEPNPPIFPDYLRTSSGQAKSVTYESPKMIRNLPISYTVKWKYDFISASPFFSYPAD